MTMLKLRKTNGGPCPSVELCYDRQGTALRAEFLEKVVELLLDYLLNLLRDSLGLDNHGVSSLDNLSRDHVEVFLDSLLKKLNG